MPILLRHYAESGGESGGKQVELLAFRHPLAGLQIVKGSIEPGEGIEAAAVRELVEEAGLVRAPMRRLGCWHNPISDQEWHFVLMASGATLPDRWQHHAPDDGGHRFDFFWQPLAAPLGEDWHPTFRAAIDWLRAELKGDVA